MIQLCHVFHIQWNTFVQPQAFQIATSYQHFFFMKDCANELVQRDKHSNVAGFIIGGAFKVEHNENKTNERV